MNPLRGRQVTAARRFGRRRSRDTGARLARARRPKRAPLHEFDFVGLSRIQWSDVPLGRRISRDAGGLKPRRSTGRAGRQEAVFASLPRASTSRTEQHSMRSAGVRARYHVDLGLNLVRPGTAAAPRCRERLARRAEEAVPHRRRGKNSDDGRKIAGNARTSAWQRKRDRWQRKRVRW
jgi:hypothetical protein